MSKSSLRLLAGLAAALFLGYVVHRGALRGNDFKYPYLAARALWRTARLHVSAQPRYPVTFHALLSPLASLPIGPAAAVWAVASIAAVAALPRVFGRLGGVPPRRQVAAWCFVGPFFVDALVLGQSDPLNLLLVGAGMLAAGRGRVTSGTGLVGLAGLIKILPLAHWATVASLHRRRGVASGIVLTAALGLGVLASATGWRGAIGGIRDQVDWIRRHEKPWHLVERGTDLRANNESLPITLARTFGALDRPQPAGTVSLARWPLPLLWAAWAMVLAALALGWLASVPSARALGPGRGGLGMLALTSIVMLAGSPICWNHYFLWLLPAALFLDDRPRLLLGLAALSLAGTASPTARGLGVHMIVALALFVLVARDLRCRARRMSRCQRALQIRQGPKEPGPKAVATRPGPAGPSPLSSVPSCGRTFVVTHLNRNASADPSLSSRR